MNMNTFNGKSIKFFWIPYFLLASSFGIYVAYGYSYSGQTLLSWLVWSGTYNDFWKVYLGLITILLFVAPFYSGLAFFLDKALSIIFFVLLVKLILILSPTVKAMSTADYYGSVEYSVVALLFIASMIWLLSRKKRESLLLLGYCSLIALVVNFQLVAHSGTPTN